MEKLIILEESTNTHISRSTGVKEVARFQTMGTVILETNGAMVVEHGHHHTVATDADTPQVIKITQQEYNPILKRMQNAFD
jgi:hypothetical protein